MAKWARIVNNVAVDISNGKPTGRYHAEILAQFETVPNAVVEGSRLVSGQWQLPVIIDTPAPTPFPVPLTYNQFVTLALTAGGMAPADYSIARSNPDLIVYFDMLMQAKGIERDDPMMAMGGAEFVTTGLLTQAGWDAMLAAWPTA